MSRRPRYLVTGLDVAAAAFVTVATAWNVWSYSGFVGTRIAGPRWLTALLPVLLGASLLWRRRWPLATWSIILAAIVAQALASGDSAEGLELVIAMGLGGYSVAANSPRPRAFVGLGLFLVAFGIYAAEDRNVESGSTGERWAGAFWGLYVIAFWLLGVFVRSRREASAVAAEAELIERDAQRALVEERSRIARELHDVIAHTVSVIGLQAGAAESVLAREPERAREALQLIQTRAREAVLELRLLLGILRDEDERAELAPQPRLAELDSVVESVRAAGVEVRLDVDAQLGTLPAGIELAAYRIVQEALTNVLRHAGATQVEIALRRRDHALELDVVDNGTNGPPAAGARHGHGLIGMRERAGLYGGTLSAGRENGGFAVRARIPVEATA